MMLPTVKVGLPTPSNISKKKKKPSQACPEAHLPGTLDSGKLTDYINHQKFGKGWGGGACEEDNRKKIFTITKWLPKQDQTTIIDTLTKKRENTEGPCP